MTTRDSEPGARRTRVWATGLLAGLLVGVVLGFVFGRSSNDATPAEPETGAPIPSDPAGGRAARSTSPPGQPAGLESQSEAALGEEIRLLQSALERERARADRLEAAILAAAPPEPEPEEKPEAETGAVAGEPDAPGTEAGATPGEIVWADESILLAAGFSEQEIDELRERFEAIELERLYLDDQARREGWRHKPRYRRESRALVGEYTAIRKDVGDESYDWVLYAAGRENRVVVGGVMGSSAAEDVGLEVGDVLLAYDGRSIFSGSELQRQTARGDSGALVAVDVGRNGESLRFYLPRGPIGIRLKAEKRTPTAVR